MSTLHKLKRQKQKAEDAENAKTRIGLKEVLLILGITLMLIGVLGGLFCYQRYSAGIPEQVINSRYGTRHIPESAAGDPSDKSNAILYITLAGIGLVLSAISVVPNFIAKHFMLPKKNQH